MTGKHQIVRSSLLRVALVLVLFSLLLAACGQPAAQPTADSSAQPTADSGAQPTADSGDQTTDSGAQPSDPGDGPTNGGDTSGLVTVSQEQQATWVRNFNVFVNDNRWPARWGIYESLIIYNTYTGETHDWLATDWQWSDDNKKLSFTLREGVQWSDGQPFTAKDVAFTFNLFKEHPGLQGNAATAWEHLESVTAVDEHTVEFAFKNVFTPALYDIGHQNIVPEHIWKDVADPLKFTNENPVGTGPFTEVAVFQNQYWELHANPNYWQEGKPYIKGFRFPSYPGNDQANLATINSENDWAANFIPDIEKTFVAKDPEHHGYWFSTTGDAVMVYVNTTKAPFDNADVRKAISMCINREQIVKVAMYGYTHPADATGLSDAYTKWKSQEAIDAGTWVNYNVDEANALLDAAGLTLNGQVRSTADGQPLKYEINVVSGWTDWVQAVQIIAQNLKQCGFDISVKTYDFSAWFDRVQKGEFDMSIGWSSGGPTPFNFYRGQMSSLSVKPVGEAHGENWHRFSTERADELLSQFAATSDFEEQKQIAAELQMHYVEQAPAIPLFPGPQWYEYNTKRFTDFPTEENPYAVGSTYKEPERLIVMTTIKPK